MLSCNIKEGNIFRLFITILVFYKLKYNDNTFIKNNLLIILPIISIIFDHADSFVIKQIYKNDVNCTHSYTYQISDKILDSLTYIFILYLLPKNNTLTFFVLFRLIGVVLFYLTKNSEWLIYFFDFIKEYLIYLFIFGNNNMVLFLFILLKFVFEFYFHTFHNKNNYKNN